MARQLTSLRRQAGVTLLELLVVLAILSLVAAVIVVNAAPGRAASREEAERFAARMTAAEEMALTASAPVRVEFRSDGYVFERFSGAAWRPATAPRFSPNRSFARDVAVNAEIADPALANLDGDEEVEARERTIILLDPLGLGQPYSVVFADRRERWRVSGGAGAPVKVEPDAR